MSGFIKDDNIERVSIIKTTLMDLLDLGTYAENRKDKIELEYKLLENITNLVLSKDNFIVSLYEYLNSNLVSVVDETLFSKLYYGIINNTKVNLEILMYIEDTEVKKYKVDKDINKIDMDNTRFIQYIFTNYTNEELLFLFDRLNTI